MHESSSYQSVPEGVDHEELVRIPLAKGAQRFLKILLILT